MSMQCVLNDLVSDGEVLAEYAISGSYIPITASLKEDRRISPVRWKIHCIGYWMPVEVRRISMKFLELRFRMRKSGENCRNSTNLL